MSFIADYDREPSRRMPRVDAHVRFATPDDTAAITRLCAERDGLDPAVISPKIDAGIRGMSDDGDNFVFVAEGPDGAVVGYSRLRRLERAPDAPANAVPTGWYLAGIVVDPAWRRRGVGAALTEIRIQWAARRSGRLFYCTGQVNRASIDLHAEFGFREIARDVFVPNMTFSGGVGLLLECSLAQPLSLTTIARRQSALLRPLGTQSPAPEPRGRLVQGATRGSGTRSRAP